MSWTLTGWARGTHRNGAPQAVRVQVLRDDHDVNEEFALRSTASGIYRREYGNWADEIGSSAVNEDGEERVLPPGRQREPGEYTVPDEAVPTNPPE